MDVCPEMATACCELFRLHNIQFIVAPYEADVQLAYLWETKKVDFVITEDSDLLAYGVGSVFYKYDMSTGDGKWIALPREYDGVGGRGVLSM